MDASPLRANGMAGVVRRFADDGERTVHLGSYEFQLCLDIPEGRTLPMVLGVFLWRSAGAVGRARKGRQDGEKIIRFVTTQKG